MDRRREAKAREGEVKEDEWRVTVNPIFIESSADDNQRVCPGLLAAPRSPDQSNRSAAGRSERSGE